MKGKIGNKIRTIICVSCGKTITDHMQPSQRYCSLECYRVSNRPQRKTGQEFPCAVCGEFVYISKARIGQGQYFCSHAHATKWQGRHKTSHVCKICGEVFRWSPSRSKAYNITYCSLRCRDADPDRRAMLLGMTAAQQRLNPNNVERAGYAILDSIGVEYDRQHLIGGKFCVDVFVPSIGLVIQFDGDYWHGNAAAFPEPNARQRKRITLDRSQDSYMAVCGYRVERIWASDIQKHPEAVTARLRALLTETAPIPAELVLDHLGA